MGRVSPDVCSLRPEANHSPPSSEEVRNAWNDITLLDMTYRVKLNTGTNLPAAKVRLLFPLSQRAARSKDPRFLPF